MVHTQHGTLRGIYPAWYTPWYTHLPGYTSWYTHTLHGMSAYSVSWQCTDEECLGSNLRLIREMRRREPLWALKV